MGRRVRHPSPGPTTRPAWSPETATALARRAGLATLHPGHWRVITSCREEAARTGRCPRLERLSALTGLAPGELMELFPGDAEALVARLAGLRRTAPAVSARRGGPPQE